MKKTKATYNIMFRDYPDVVNVNEMCKMLGGISAKLAYKLLSSNRIQSIKIGRTYKIPKVFIVEYLIGQNEQNIWISNTNCDSMCAVNGR